MRSWKPRDFAVICWTAVTIHTTSGFAVVFNSANHHALFSRAGPQCNGDSSLTYCGNGLPDYFCCSVGTICKQLNNTATPAAICCPSGSDCSSLTTISCNASTQAIPKAPAHMLDIKVPLPTCGSLCCPLGYQCVNDRNVFSCLIKDVTKQAQSSTTTQPASSTSAIASSVSSGALSTPESQSTSGTAIPVSSSTSAPAGPSGQSTLQPPEKPKNLPIAAILAGLIPGIFFGAVLVLGIFFLLKRRRDRQRTRSTDTLFGGPLPQISSPIYRAGMSDRTEFMHTRNVSGNSTTTPLPPMFKVSQSSQNLRRTFNSDGPLSGGTLVSQKQQNQGRTPKLSLGPVFETPTRPQKAEQNPVRALFSKTPQLRTSQETIDVLMRPSGEAYGQASQEIAQDDVSPVTPVTPTMLYADVYRAAGVSPSKAESRARQLALERGDGRF